MTSSTAPAVVAIDPGGRYAGVAVLAAGPRPRLLAAAVLTRDKPDNADRYGRWFTGDTLAPWLTRTLDVIDRAIDQAVSDTYTQRGIAPAPTGAPLAPVVAVEAVTPPNKAHGIANVAGLLATAAVVGAILARYPRAVLIQPAGNGAGPPAAYPELIRPGASRLGGPSTHARSAYDVALAARNLHTR